MHLIRKVLLNLSLAVILLVVFYCYQTSNGIHWIEHNLTKNGSEQNIPTSVNNVTELDTLPKTLAFHKSNDYNVWCIFCKVTTNSPMRRKFHIFVQSLLNCSSVDITFHVITDDNSHPIADSVIQEVMINSKRGLKVRYYDVHKLAEQLQDIVSAMSPHFSSRPGTYYSDALFFLSLGLHRIAPTEQKLAIMLDADTKFRTDVKELFDEFKNFGSEALFGLAPELTPVYRHVLYLYRSKNPNTTFGEPSHSGGYPGYNSGMVLFHLERLRLSTHYNSILTKESTDVITQKYNFKGHLGDQDFYTLLGMEYPKLIHTVDCGWNRQLCTWWKRGYSDVFAKYSRCDSVTKLWHGNCNTPIPDD